ncbi:MAG TPA: histidinol-phosphatase [Chthonomonadales bacterium]|nr:histidinol-phosphatase [Chthonomonadales bacterium]
MIQGIPAIDYQVHSFRSHDGRASIEQQCARAIELGLDEIGFSEHKDFDPADPAVDYFDYAAYLEEIDHARRTCGSRLKIRAGVEIDYQVRFEEEIRQYLATHRFDFVLGSVHYVEGVMLMTPEYNRIRTARQAYKDYFVAVRQSVESGLFDIVGHLEYANRRGVAAWGPYSPAPYRQELESLFGLMLERGVTLELNTAGLHQGIGMTYPCRETMALFTECGGRAISVGSDAHHPDQLAFSYANQIAAARALGIDRLRTWSGRRHSEIKL